MKRFGIPREEAPLRLPWFQASPTSAVVVVASLFALVLAVRLVVGDTPDDAVSMLYALPVALAATAFGRVGGLVAGLVAVALFAGWVVAIDADLTWLGWASRIVPLVLLGVLLGDASQRLAAAERKRQALEAAAQQHRNAAEISDSLLQGMSAAKWALEAERYDVAGTTLEETIAKGQRLVADLLRGAELRPGQSGPPPDRT
jgi:signal transduction histidine kinase